MSSLIKAKTLEEKRAALIIKYRNLTIDSREKEEGKIVFHLSRGENKFLMHILLGKSTIGIAYLRELRNELEKHNATSGIIVGDGKYTYSARSSASDLNLELIPKTLPNFDITMGKDYWDIENADWIRESDDFGFSNAAVAVPLKLGDRQIVFSGANSRNNIVDLDQNNVFLDPHPGRLPSPYFSSL